MGQSGNVSLLGGRPSFKSEKTNPPSFLILPSSTLPFRGNKRFLPAIRFKMAVWGMEGWKGLPEYLLYHATKSLLVSQLIRKTEIQKVICAKGENFSPFCRPLSPSIFGNEEPRTSFSPVTSDESPPSHLFTPPRPLPAQISSSRPHPTP